MLRDSDAYRVFQRMPKSGNPPDDLDQPVGEGEAGEQAKGNLTPDVLAGDHRGGALLDSGSYSIGALGVLAADTSLNTANINLVGLAQTGIEFA